jgi:hypothetical protein
MLRADILTVLAARSLIRGSMLVRPVSKSARKITTPTLQNPLNASRNADKKCPQYVRVFLFFVIP